MYLDFFGFREEPFNITPNTRFLFLSDRHKEALGSLRYGIEQRKGFIALTGEIGCGKTTVCRALLGSLDRARTRIALVLNPELSDVELLQTINAEYGLPAKSSSKRELLDALNSFLLAEYGADRNVVLVIDEAQRLLPAALEQVRLLSNLETETAKLLQIALVGQPELAELLRLPQLEQLNQRITVRCHISPLSDAEVTAYVRHRLEIAGPRRPVEFDNTALALLAKKSGGVPRRINVLCDRALLVAFTKDETRVTKSIMKRAVSEVGFSVNHEHPAEPEAPPPAPVREGASQGLPFALFAGLVVVAIAIFATRPTPAPQVIRVEAPPAPTAVPIIIHATPVPSPSPSPTPQPTASPAPSPVPTPAPTAAPVVPTPDPRQVVTLVPSATFTPVPTPIITPTPIPTPTPVPPEAAWAYDAIGTLRVSQASQTFPAAVLTWMALTRGSRLAAADLARLRDLPTEELATLRLTSGAPPLYLREARLPSDPAALRALTLPILVQFDDMLPAIGPWSVLMKFDTDSFELRDPRAGTQRLPLAILDEHLTSAYGLYADPAGVTGLAPGAEGPAVTALQEALRRADVFGGATTGRFDPITEASLARFRRDRSMAEEPTVDAATALALLGGKPPP